LEFWALDDSGAARSGHYPNPGEFREQNGAIAAICLSRRKFRKVAPSSQDRLNQTRCRRTKPQGRRDAVCRNVTLAGGISMKCLGSGLIRQAVKAGAVVAALVLSTSAGLAQARPFAGFDGAWSGNGTVSLSDGTSERLRCRAVYQVDGTGLVLKQTLRCASDSYKFDLSSDVTSHGDHITGNWSETNRNISGSLLGTAGSGKIDVTVESPGFTASLTLRTSGNKQTVQITSKGDIRGVSITMVKS
jgi:hypothetical protein